jgi:hypothetical protein
MTVNNDTPERFSSADELNDSYERQTSPSSKTKAHHPLIAFVRMLAQLAAVESSATIREGHE